MPPLILALFIVLCVGLVGAFAAFVRDRVRYSGYRDIMREAIGFGKTVDGELFRDGGDLVISGEQEKMPLIVRFSHAESTPGLRIRMGAPATFSLDVFARGQAGHIGTLVKSPDDIFNTKFEIRSDQPTVAQLFLEAPKVTAALKDLCRSGHDLLTLAPSAIEYGQLGYPNSATMRALPGFVGSLNSLREALIKMPGSEQVKVEPRQRQRDYILRATIVAGVIAVAATLYITAHDENRNEKPVQEVQLPEGMSATDASAISNLNLWRSATEKDSDEAVLGVMRDHHVAFTAYAVLDANGAGEANDHAYLLVNDRGERRLVLMVDGSKVHDSRYAQIAAIGRVTKAHMAQIKWRGSPPASYLGDGLLVVRTGDPGSGTVLYLGEGNRVQSSVPEDWRQVEVGQ